MVNLTSVLDYLHGWLQVLNGFVWGPWMLAVLLGTGLYLTTGLRLMTLRRIGYAFRQLMAGRRGVGQGEITPFNSLMTSLSATIGTGNIAGVATAIAAGGPGALFWMWCTALVGMATKYAEAVLAVNFREIDVDGRYCGGPMYYIKNGLGRRWLWLAAAFALFGSVAGFGIGNMVQANSVARVLLDDYHVAPLTSGLVLMVLAGLVIIGGIRRIASVAGALVPVMAIAYVVAGVAVIVVNVERLPATIAMVVESAFTGHAAVGGFAGATIWAALHMGVARGIFSNEAGLGSAPIAHAAARTDSPVRQGTIAMLGTFIDTLVVCSITGLAILLSGDWASGKTGAALASDAFTAGLPFGNHVIAIGLALFAFSTILGWSYYCERCVEYLFGPRGIGIFRMLWVVAIPVGATRQLATVWQFADTFNGLMAVPNLLALLLLSPVVFRLTRRYWAEGASD